MSVKQTQYDQYVTSGQAGQRIGQDAETQFASNRPYIERTIRLHIPGDPSIRIVDLGCGQGSWIYFLKKNGYTNIAGVDISGEQVERAHELGIGEVQLGSLESFIEHEEKIDVVLLMDILEHFAISDSDVLLRRIAEKLNPGGKLLIHVPNGEGLFGQRIRYGDLTHETCFTPKSMNQLLTPRGYRNIQCFEDRPIIHGLVSAIRRVLWDVGTIYPRVLLAAETGEKRCVLSQNMTVVATRDSDASSGVAMH